MSRIRGLEVQFNLVKKNLKSTEDCIVVALHSLMLNENLLCAGTGDKWPEGSFTKTELLPEEWNRNQEVYSLRYVSEDLNYRFLLKVVKVESMLLVHVVKNENLVATMSILAGNYVPEGYSEYSSTYQNLQLLVESFRRDVMQKLRFPPEKGSPRKGRPADSSSKSPPSSSNPPPTPMRPSASLDEGGVPGRFIFPRVGGSDLNPVGGGGGGGMLMDPNNMGIPTRPTFPQFGVGGPQAIIPRAAVPPGARFDPIIPPIIPDPESDPHPDTTRPPNKDD